MDFLIAFRASLDAGKTCQRGEISVRVSGENTCWKPG